MNAAIVSRTLSMIPDRVARAQSGSLFDPQAADACAHPERITHLAQFLNWLGPLREVTKDDLRIFGLLTPYGKPAIAIDADPDDEADVELELEAAAAAEPQDALPLVVTLPLATEEEGEPALT
jgi:hypothetical protein